METRRALSVTLVQMSAGADERPNADRAAERIARAAAADLIVLPEVFHVRGTRDDYHRAAEPIPGPLTARFSALAARRGAWLLLGSMIERDGGRVFNTSVLLDRRGGIAARYRKIHLFSARLDAGQTVREEDTYSAGTEPVLTSLEGWRCGLAICYDLRFPELFRHYAALGADLLLVPSNFTQRTGKDHWEVLLRARAIENQCYVAAADQCGADPRTGVESHGHSMIVGPWGEVLAEAGTDEGLVSATLDPGRLAEVRSRIPALAHRRL
jgi:predicted amidohydrolase